MKILRKDFEFIFEEEDIEAFRKGIQGFTSLVEELEKGLIKTKAITGSRRGGGKRPPFIKNAVLELMEKEPSWFVDKFPEDVANKLKTQYGVVGAKVSSVKVVLIRLFNEKRLTRKEIQGKYAYSVLTIPK
jgi:hypothetical protein